MAREVVEETGLDVEVGPVVEVLDRIQRSEDARIEYHYIIIDYLCRCRSGRLACGSEADDVRWVNCADLPQYKITEKANEVIHKAFTILKSSNPEFRSSNSSDLPISKSSNLQTE